LRITAILRFEFCLQTGENQGELNVWGDHQTADAITCQVPLITRMPGSHRAARVNLSAGPLPPNPAEMLSPKRMQEILCDLRDLADIVIIDSPPVSAISDAMILSTYVDAVLAIVK